jgi:cobalamin synthase
MISYFTFVSVSPDSLPIAILALFLLGAAVLYSIRIAYTLIVRYRTANSSEVGYVAVGLLFLTAVPIILHFILASIGSVSGDVIDIVTALSELVGLLAILVTIYEPGGKQ